MILHCGFSDTVATISRTGDIKRVQKRILWSIVMLRVAYCVLEQGIVVLAPLYDFLSPPTITPEIAGGRRARRFSVLNLSFDWKCASFKDLFVI